MLRCLVSPRNLIRRRRSIGGRNFLKVSNGPFRLRKSWSRAPADGAQLGQPPNPPVQTGTAARWARGRRDAVGAHGCRHRRLDNSFRPRLRAHRPPVNQRRRSSRIPGGVRENAILSSTKLRARSPDRGGANGRGHHHGHRRTVVLGCSRDWAPDELVPVNLKALRATSGVR